MSDPQLTLYASPFACSLAAHIVLLEQQRPFQVVWVDRITHQLADGSSFDAINPKGKVAAVRLPDGTLLTEMVALLTWLDERTPRSADESQRLLEWLTFLATEVHKQLLFPWFHPKVNDGTRAFVQELREPVFDVLEQALSQQPTLLGPEEPSVADAYLLWTLLLGEQAWGRFLGDGLKAFRKRMLARPSVQQAIATERALL